MADRLTFEQACDLLECLGLSPRHIMICRRRMEGWLIAEIAAELGVGERRVYALLRDVKRILGAGRRGEAPSDRPGCSPYYGWQEVFLDSQRRR